MLYDLNIAWSPSTGTADLDRTLKFSASLGYDVVALNHTIQPPIPGQITNPLPQIDPAKDQQQENQPARQKLPTVLRRATVVLADPSQNYRLPQVASSYDIVALRPTTDKAFAAACLNISADHASLISLDMAQRLPFPFRPKPCMAAVNRGLRFEICYAQALSPTAEPRARASFIGNVSSLLRATRGRGVVISSEARHALELRGPADVVNLLAVWGLGTEKGMEGLGVNPRGVVANERLRRTGFRGVVDIVGLAEREAKSGDADGDTEMAEGGSSSTGDATNKKRKQPHGTKDGNDKSKNGKQIKGDQRQQQSGETGSISKRQAKKMKAAMKKSQSGEAE